MLQTILSIGQALEPKENSAFLKMVDHDRMAGSVPVWEKAKTAKEATEQRFANALEETIETTSDTSAYRMSLAPEEVGNIAIQQTEKPFGFGDLVDIINPLHHIPIVGSIYRNLSNDTIRGPGKVIGGALFGGPIGAAASMINMLVKYDTGRDITGHALNLRDNNTSASSEKVSSSVPKQTNTQVTEAILAYESSQNISNPYISTKRL